MAPFFLASSSLMAAAPASLAEALARVEARLDAWAADTTAYNNLLLQVFAAAGTEPALWQQAAAELQGTLQSSGLAIHLELLSSAELPGLNGAYTANAPGGGERIFLNCTWLQGVSAVQIEAVLLEEFGHAIDRRLNGSADSPGDEGERFSALLRGLQPSAAILSENDQHTLFVGGQVVAIEAADTTAPVAITTAPAYAAAETNFGGLASLIYNANPSFADIDGDGDLDACIGDKYGNTFFFRNTAAAGSSTPAYDDGTGNPFGLVNVGSYARPSFVDIDGDGDLDAFIGERYGNTLFFRNTAAAGSTTPTYAGAVINPFGLADGGSFASPNFVDIDGDGDLDALMGNGSGNTLFFRNTAAVGSTTPAYAAAVTNPFGLADVGLGASPSFVDIDGDGDLDAFIGNTVGNTLFFRNTAAAGNSTPAYTAAALNPFGLTDVGDDASPSFADIDGDGDLDAFIGERYGSPIFRRNTAPSLGVSSSTANGSYGAGAIINLTVTFSETVLVTGAPRLQLETGLNDRFAVYTSGSGTSTLTFAYTVQAGDSSADLDVLGSSALRLDGGTIKDAAGNNAVLTLAAPGSPASLAARKNLEIAGALVTGVTSPTANGAYGVGAVITLTVTYSQAVLVTGTPRLLLETGSTDRFAVYTGGSGTSALSFAYTVQAGDTSTDLDILSASALSLHGGTIKDVAFGNNASLALAAPGASGSLGANKNLVIDGVVPVAITTTPAYATATDNPFGLAGVGFSASPSFADIDGDGDLDALIGNSDGNTLFFRNTAAAGSTTPAYAAASANPFGLANVGISASPSFVDMDGDGDLDAFIGNYDGNTIFFRNTAAAGSSTPAYAAATANPFGLATVGISASPSFVDIDGDGDLDALIGNRDGNTLFFRNTAAAGSTTPAYAAAAANPFGLATVGISASPSFVDIDGDGDLDAFIGNSDGSILFFRYTAAAGSSTPAYATAFDNPFGLADGGFSASPSFVDIDGDGDLDGFIGNQYGDTLFVLNTAPVLGVSSSTASGTYGVGAVITLTVTFSETVLVTGAPRLQLETGLNDRFAVYTGGSGTSTLTFAYTVQAGDSSADLDVLNSAALTLNGGTINDATGNNAVLTLAAPGSPASLAARKNLVIAGALVTSVTSPTANGAYGVGAVINLTVTYSQAVLVTGTPRLLLETGSTDRFAVYTGGSGTSTLNFSYTVQPGDTSTDLDILSASALLLNGGTIKDVAFGNNASLALAAPGAFGSLGDNKNLVIDGVVPVAITTTPAYATASANPFGLSNVGISTSPSFVDIDGDGDLDALIGNSDGNTLFFRNTAAAGSSIPAYAALSANPFGLATVGISASPSFVDIDGDGDLDAFIGNSYGNTLFFRNTSAPGSTSPAYSAPTANPFGLANVGFTASPNFIDIDGDGDLDAFIGNYDGNTLFFRNTAAAGSSTPAYAAATDNPFGLADVGFSASPSFVDIDGDGDLDAFIGNYDGNTLFFRNTAAGGSSTPAYAAATDNPFGLADGGFYASPSLVDFDGDGDFDAFIGNQYGNTPFFRNTAPSLGVSSTTINGSYGVGAVITLTVTFSETVLVTGAPRLQLETGLSDHFAVYTGGSGTSTLTFAYTVQAGDSSADLDVLSSSALTLNGGSIKDAVGNNAVLTLAAPGSLVSLAARKNLVINGGAADGIAPVITAGPTPTGVSGISVTANEAGTAALFKADNSQLFPTALTANTAATLTLAAQATITTATLRVADLAGNLTSAAPGFWLGTTGADAITGGAGADFLYGFSGNDSLNGGAGVDTLIGGDGGDTYTIETVGDLVLETNADAASGGTDTVRSSLAAYTLTANVENLTLTGAASTNGTGNTLNNTITGNTAANSLSGDAGADTLDGGEGADTLNGGSGNDSLTGRGGNDTYIIDSVGDAVLEFNPDPLSGGLDTVLSSLAAYTLAANVENLTLTGAAAINGTGNTLNNRLTGNTAANSLSGDAGADTLDGGEGADTLNGGSGNDSLTGRGGNDTYIIDSVGDSVLEFNPDPLSGGLDTVLSSLAAYTLAVNVENLTLTGAAAINGAGNTLNNRLTGNTAANSLSGDAGADTLDGGEGADTLNGGSGNDSLTGRGGNDTYIIDSVGDSVLEFNPDPLTGGVDTVLSALAAYTLAANVENLTLTGVAAINGTGNTLNNRLTGNTGANLLSGDAGADTLSGGDGNDTLTGGLGADTFRFDSPLNAATNGDLITDFTLAQVDRIELENSVFTALPTTGALAASAFRSGAAATSAEHRILFDSATGLLSFDSDGTGAAAAIAFATLTPGLGLSSSQFTVT